MSLPDNLCASLEKLFHEPNRLAIVSALCGADNDGLSFKSLKEDCSLTDGNLSRHLKTLEEAGAVRIEKSFVGSRPRTSSFASYPTSCWKRSTKRSTRCSGPTTSPCSRSSP